MSGRPNTITDNANTMHWNSAATVLTTVCVLVMGTLRQTMQIPLQKTVKSDAQTYRIYSHASRKIYDKILT